MPPRPSFGVRPAAASVSPYWANVFGKKARTTWPKMIGSETFIIVALRCTENSTPSALARAICAVRNSRSAATRMTDASTTSPGEHRYRLAQHGGGAVVAGQLDAQRAGLGDDRGLLGGAEVVGAHVRDVRLRVGGPGAHAVRVGLGVVLDRGGGAAVGVALAQDRVDGAALDLVVAGADVALLVGLRVVRVVRQRVALLLQLGDRGLELRDRRRDVRQLDDVRLGRLGQLAELGEGVGDALVLLEVLGEAGDDAPGQRDVAGLHGDPGLEAYAWTTGRNEYVARAGASSVCV